MSLPRWRTWNPWAAQQIYLLCKQLYQLKGKAYEGTPTFANKQKVANSPYTGDNLQILMWGGLVILSAFVLVVLFLVARK